MRLRFVALFAPVLLLTAAAASPAPPAAQQSELIDVQTATCAQFANAKAYAKPVEKPTTQQEEFAALAQDDLVLAMTWVNGYLAGRDGAKASHPFTKDWVVTYMGKLSAVCNANSGAMLLKDAAAKL